MTVKNVQKDLATLTMVVTAEFSAPAARVWQLWADPRQLERWWGPPTYPATVVDHDFVPGGRVTYFMTGPEGDKHQGWWRILAIDAPRSLELQDGFADDTGTPDPDMPSTTMRMTLAERASGTEMLITTTFPSLEAMQQMIEMGMEQGLQEAMGQMDDILA
jgi:uncharacterized protein YndB with AHSA1/START domain